MRKSYPSDISRKQFKEIREELSKVKKVTQPRSYDLYDIFCAILYLLKEGCTWRAIPHDFPNWQNVRYHYDIWSNPAWQIQLPTDTHERLIPRNPTDDCIAPKVQKVEIKTLRPKHLKSYLEAADARGVLPMFYLELVSGLRKGELAALLWDDLNMQNRTISLSKQYLKTPSGKLTLSRPKIETSVRRVSIPQEAVDLLVQEHEKHPENPYMFPSSTTGEMYYPDSVVKLHEKILQDAGLEHIRFHDGSVMITLNRQSLGTSGVALI